MKKIQLILLLVIVVIYGAMAQSTKRTQYLRPTNLKNRVSTIVAGKTRNYYSLNTDTASSISVRGPGMLRVLTRGRFVSAEGGKINYGVIYSIDGGDQLKFNKSKVERSEKASYANDSLGVPGQLKVMEIELGRGSHTIEFKLQESGVPVAARYVFKHTKAKKQAWVTFSPVKPSEPVDLVTRERIVKYYRFSSQKPLKIEINGQTELQILTRIENHYNMKGRIHYRVQVKENGEVVNTYQLSSVRSEVTGYKNDETLIPGKASTFVINVPKGNHTYEIVPLDEDKNTLLGRLLLPKKDIGIVK
ncbi:MAG: hypothetical protein HQ521_05745 [Bacteroidetes bacterium]|nr:hypothetical protein [Bacteroidota bacterium]